MWQESVGFTHALDVRLLEYASLAWYTEPLPLLSLAKCDSWSDLKPKKLERVRENMHSEYDTCSSYDEWRCLEHAVALKPAPSSVPSEYVCNRTTRLCNGFAAASNVYGAARAVLRPLLDIAGAQMPHDVRDGANKAIAAAASANANERPTAAELLSLFEDLLNKVGGEACVNEHLKQGKVAQAFNAIKF